MSRMSISISKVCANSNIPSRWRVSTLNELEFIDKNSKCTAIPIKENQLTIKYETYTLLRVAMAHS